VGISLGIFQSGLYFLRRKLFSSRSCVALVLESRFSGAEVTF
jgi:hypothetical protein